MTGRNELFTTRNSDESGTYFVVGVRNKRSRDVVASVRLTDREFEKFTKGCVSFAVRCNAWKE